MRYWFNSIALVLMFCCCFALSSVGQEARPIFTPEKQQHSFGKIAEMGGQVSYEFVFTNTGNQPLIVQSATASCGCTAPSWSKEPIMPNKSGKIKVQFNPLGRPGAFSKTVTIQHNGSPSTDVLVITGEVIAGPKKPEPKEFTQFFPYNEKAILMSSPEFEAFIASLKELLAVGKKLTISIESSASRVPTDRYKSNEELTVSRANEARSKMVKALKKAGIAEELVFFHKPLTRIQGPEYDDDWKENIKIYEQYQYVKIVVK